MNASDRREETRLRLAKAALASPLAFGRIVCGFGDLDDDFHGMMSQWIMRPAKRKLMLAPRGHLKTSVVTIADSLRRATINPDLTLAIVNETEKLPMKWVGQMQAIVTSQTYKWLYPDRVPDLANAKIKWNATQLTLARTIAHAQATIEVFGVGGASTGNHYRYIVEDDLVGKEARESPSIMAKAIDQHKLGESLLVDPGNDTIVTVGTRWHPYDLARWMLEHEPDIDFIKFGWCDPLGEPVWPARFPRREIERLRRKYGTVMFKLMYENEAISEGLTSLRADWLGVWAHTTTPEGEPAIKLNATRDKPERVFALRDCTTFMIIDPALSPASEADRSAFVTVALTPEKPFSIVVLDAVAKRIAPKALVDEAAVQWARFDPRPSVVGIEVVAAQQTFFYWIPTIYPELPLRRLATSTHKRKETRIREFAVYAEQGRLYVNPAQTDLLEEWETFPSGRTVDLLDALAYTPQVWFPPSGGGLTEEGESDPFVDPEQPPWVGDPSVGITGY